MDYQTKRCKICDEEFEPTGGRQVYCAKHRDRIVEARPGRGAARGPQSRPPDPELVTKALTVLAEVRRRLESHNVAPTPALLRTRTRAVAEAYRADDRPALHGALIDLAVCCVVWVALDAPFSRLRGELLLAKDVA
jgi:hypothetical protein